MTSPAIRKRQPADLADEVVPEEVELADVTLEEVIDPIFNTDVPIGKRSEIAQTIHSIGKLHGTHVLHRASRSARFKHMPTGIFTLDMGLLGGLVRSLMGMVYGWESSGKSTQAFRMIANAQRLYPEQDVVLLDAEGTYDKVWGATNGIDNDRLILSQPDNGQQAVDVARMILKARDVSFLVVDSLPALMPTQVMEKSAEDATVALQASLIGLLVRTVSQSLIDERKRGHLPAVLFINQFRDKIVRMGSPRHLPGGNALKFFVSQRWEVKNQEILGKDAQGNEIVDHNDHTWTITKNKVGNSIRNGAYTMIRNPNDPFGVGFIDEAKEVLAYARSFGLLTGSGSSWYLDGVMDISNTKPLRLTKLQEVADYFYSDLDYFDSLKHRMICMQRASCGLEAEGWL